MSSKTKFILEHITVQPKTLENGFGSQGFCSDAYSL